MSVTVLLSQDESACELALAIRELEASTAALELSCAEQSSSSSKRADVTNSNTAGSGVTAMTSSASANVNRHSLQSSSSGYHSMTTTPACSEDANLAGACFGVCGYLAVDDVGIFSTACGYVCILGICIRHVHVHVHVVKTGTCACTSACTCTCFTACIAGPLL